MKLRSLSILLAFLFAGHFAAASDINALVLEQIRTMPDGGGYATTREAHAALNSSVQLGSGAVSIQPAKACPSYCSGATYLVFLKTLQAAEKKGLMPPLGSVWASLTPKSSPDGVGIWGRWNANGPGASRLFHELALGRNFTSYAEARPGDFLKIFWSDAVGKNERGHLVVFLGEEEKDGVPHVRFWSSNKPHGYGEKTVPKSKIARAIFSRLESPSNIRNLTTIPKKDDYLAGLLTRESSFAEALHQSGIKAP
ncbi:MAG: hypothetical protein ACO3GO_03570 [Terrimicrobiaceae bacterium]